MPGGCIVNTGLPGQTPPEKDPDVDLGYLVPAKRMPVGVTLLGNRSTAP